MEIRIPNDIYDSNVTVKLTFRKKWYESYKKMWSRTYDLVNVHGGKIVSWEIDDGVITYTIRIN